MFAGPKLVFEKDVDGDMKMMKGARWCDQKEMWKNGEDEEDEFYWELLAFIYPLIKRKFPLANRKIGSTLCFYTR